MSQLNSKLIARNTLMLYIRMFVILAVSLYTSRVILKVLGIDDYGIYNLIAGFITIVSFISNSLISVIQRYFNVALGEKDNKRFTRLYSASLNLMLLLGGCILLVGETIGLWFISNQMNIPSDRQNAALWVFHFSLLTFIANLLTTTFRASIISHERMNFYAYISIVEALLRLGIVFILNYLTYDKLILYSVLYFVVSVVLTCINWLYCFKSFDECRYVIKGNRNEMKGLLNFSGWTLLGQSAVVFRSQGEALLVNRFFSVAANASMGIANQVTSAIEMFVSNFQTAFNPQIVKTFAAKEYTEHHNLLLRTSKLSYFLLLLLALPVIFNINVILDLWLDFVPKYTDKFCLFILISYLLNALGAPFMTSIFATGRIKKYQILFACIFLIGLLSSYVFLLLGYPPYITAIVSVFVQCFVFLSRLMCSKNLIDLNLKKYFKDVIIPILGCTIIMSFLYLITCLFVSNFISLLSVCALDTIMSLIIIYFIGLSTIEKGFVRKLIKNKIS